MIFSSQSMSSSTCADSCNSSGLLMSEDVTGQIMLEPVDPDGWQATWRSNFGQVRRVILSRKQVLQLKDCLGRTAEGLRLLHSSNGICQSTSYSSYKHKCPANLASKLKLLSCKLSEVTIHLRYTLMVKQSQQLNLTYENSRPSRSYYACGMQVKYLRTNAIQRALMSQAEALAHKDEGPQGVEDLFRRDSAEDDILVSWDPRNLDSYLLEVFGEHASNHVKQCQPKKPVNPLTFLSPDNGVTTNIFCLLT